MKFLKIESKHVQGILEPGSARKYPFQRFPQRYKKKIRREVWDLSENSAGVCFSFSTNSINLFIKWNLKNDFKMRHMTDVGISGLDLYQKRYVDWYFISTGIPEGLNNESYLYRGYKRKLRHFRIHLPLYNILTNLELGIDSDAIFHFKYDNKAPLVFYGTSITQGGCASRPGLAYTNIISRKLNRPCINLGFSGNGHLEASIGRIFSNIQEAIFIIDCMWNIDKNVVIKDTQSFISIVSSKRDNYQRPIIFHEQYMADEYHPDEEAIKLIVKKNNALRNQIEKQINNGFKNLFLIGQNGCIDEDSEATVDGVHFNDLGFVRFANHFITEFKKLDINI